MPNSLSCHTCCATCKCPTLSSAFEVMCKVCHKVSQNVYTKHVEFGTQSGMTSSVHDITPKSITWLDSGYKTQVCKNPETLCIHFVRHPTCATCMTWHNTERARHNMQITWILAGHDSQDVTHVYNMHTLAHAGHALCAHAECHTKDLHTAFMLRNLPNKEGGTCRAGHTKCSICMPNSLSCHTCCATCKCPTLSSAFEVMCKVCHKVSQNVYTKHVEFGTQSGMTSSVHDITPKSITWLDSGYKTQVCKNPDT